MGPLGRRDPKSVLPVGNRPLIAIQIESLRIAGISDVIVVIGHRGATIKQLLGDGSDLGVRIRYVCQRTRCGSAHATATVERHVDRPFVLLLGDIHFEAGDLGDMMRAYRDGGGCSVLATDKTPSPAALRRNYAVYVGGEGRVTGVVEKPHYEHVPRGVEMGVGIYLFDLPIFDAIRSAPRAGPDEEDEITTAIQSLIDGGNPVRSVEAVHGAVNMTTLSDLLAVNLRLAEGAGEALIGPGCRIHEGARIEGSVVGANVTIGAPISVRRSLVLASTRIDGAASIEDSVVAPGMVQRCAARSPGPPRREGAPAAGETR